MRLSLDHISSDLVSTACVLDTEMYESPHHISHNLVYAGCLLDDKHNMLYEKEFTSKCYQSYCSSYTQNSVTYLLLRILEIPLTHFLFESSLSLSLISLSLTLLYDTIILSTELLLHMPSSADRLKNSVSSLFEEWWRLGLEGRFDLVTNTLIYLLQRSLSHKGVNTICFFNKKRILLLTSKK